VQDSLGENFGEADIPSRRLLNGILRAFLSKFKTKDVQKMFNRKHRLPVDSGWKEICLPVFPLLPPRQILSNLIRRPEDEKGIFILTS